MIRDKERRIGAHILWERPARISPELHNLGYDSCPIDLGVDWIVLLCKRSPSRTLARSPSRTLARLLVLSDSTFSLKGFTTLVANNGFVVRYMDHDVRQQQSADLAIIGTGRPVAFWVKALGLSWFAYMAFDDVKL